MPNIDDAYFPHYVGLSQTDVAAKIEAVEHKLSDLEAKIDQMNALLWQLVLTANGVEVPLEQSDHTVIISARGINLK